MKILLITCCLLISIPSFGQKKALEKSNPAVDTLRKAVEELKGDFSHFQKMYNELKSKHDSLARVTNLQETKLAKKDNPFQFHDLIAIYAAIVSTIVGLVQIFKYLREVRNKLVVRFFIGSQAIHYGNTIGEWMPVFTVNVVNHSLTDRFIRQPGIKAKNVDGPFFMLDIQNPVPYPIKLSPGQEWELHLHHAPVIQKLVEIKSNQIRVIIEDTLGNTYKSKWLVVD